MVAASPKAQMLPSLPFSRRNSSVSRDLTQESNQSQQQQGQGGMEPSSSHKQSKIAAGRHGAAGTRGKQWLPGSSTVLNCACEHGFHTACTASVTTQRCCSVTAPT